MSTNISKQQREDLLNKIKAIRAFISAAPQDEARAILKKFGIGINDADNGVWLPQSIHRGRHHKAYIDVVLRRLQNATNANDAKAILHSIATDLANGNLLL